MREVTRHGISFLVNSDTVNNDFWDIDNWELENYSIVYEISKTTSTFINAGGWIGPFTLFASKVFKDVFSLEPDIVAFEELKSNITLNQLTNVKIYNKAYSNEDSFITIGSDHSDLGRSGTSIFQTKNSIQVQSSTLETFFKEENIPFNSFLMLDVEGAEYLLFDNYEFFRKNRPTILLSLHLTLLSDCNFNVLIERLGRLESLYEFDLKTILSSRASLSFNSHFRELNILMIPKI